MLLRNFYLFLLACLLLGISLLTYPVKSPTTPYVPQPIWQVRSIDTMKYSRDLAREKLHDDNFIPQIDLQVGAIASAGATHVAIGTPYDDEFIPFLSLWVKAARKYNLHVWFRGNFSGWEKWFDYPAVSRQEHTSKLVNFIKQNPSLFENGDLFSSCPECENGGPGDPRSNNDLSGHRAFLIAEYQAAAAAFRLIGKDVNPAFNSMNYDVAKLVMDPETTAATGGIVAIDHYVKDPAALGTDIQSLADSSQGKVFLGEFGAPIPDIHGEMTEKEQADWLDSVLTRLRTVPSLYGLNYWTSFGGSTALWQESGVPNQAVGVLKNYYTIRQ